MSLKVVFLGTSSAIPVPNRSFPSIAVLRKDEVIMIDCGEGTQRQMVLSKIGFGRKMKIIITHLHGDHVGGIIGLLQTMGMLKRIRPVEIYGPRGIKGFIRSAMQYLKIKLQYQLLIEEVKEGLVLQEKEYEVYATRANHLIKSYSYLLKERLRPGRFDVDKARKLGIPKGPLWHKIQSGERIILNNKIIEPDMVLGPPRPGRILGFSGDTRPNRKLSEFFKGADLLIFEATYSDKDFEKAVENMHSTSVEAAKIGAKAGAKMLALIHLSARYDNPSIIEAEATKHFSNVVVANDLEVIEVPYPDSGEPFKRYQIKSF
ncbi:MAG: ribonuclease Z [Nitrososphaeria archaeon]